jgi:8-oxo-dGTP diphosphatase
MGKSDQGIDPKRYTLIPRTLCFLFRDSQVLLINGAPSKKIWAGKYNGLGGHIERGEDVLTSARREIQEESGLQPDELWLCGVITVDAGLDYGIGLFVLKGYSEFGTPVNSGEGRLEWVDLGNLGAYNLVEDLITLLPKVASQSPGSLPFSAHYEYDPEDNLVIKFAED